MKDREKKLDKKISTSAKNGQYGMDIVMLLDNLERTPAERIRRHQLALDMFDKFHNAANKQ